MTKSERLRPSDDGPAADLAAFGSAVIDEAAEADSRIEDRDWIVPPEGAVTSFFAAPSGPLAMIALGNPANPRILLVPGVTGSKEDFTLMMPGLVEAGYFVQAYDLAGQYESSGAGPERLGRRHFDYELFVDDLMSILRAGSTPTHVLGYSFAGTVAQLAYVREPGLFASLTFLSTPPQPGQGFRGVKRIGWLSRLLPARLGAIFMIWGLHRNVTHVPPGRQRFVEHRLQHTRREAVYDIFGLMMHTPDSLAALAAASVPKLVAVGEHDLWPLALHRGFASAIEAKIAVYRTGHSPCETAPNQLNRDLLALFAPQ